MSRIELQVHAKACGEASASWHPLDTGGASLSVDYVSNLFGDVSKVQCSHSHTFRLPRTRNNDDLFDLAVIPQHGGTMQYRRMQCRCFADGVDLAGDAWLHIASATSDSYSVVMTFGVLQEYADWIGSGKSIRDIGIDNEDNQAWNLHAANTFSSSTPVWFGGRCLGTYTPSSGLGMLWYYGDYRPGFLRNDARVHFANVHPFVTMREIWERIRYDNGLAFTMPQDVLDDMETVAVVLTSKAGNTPVGNTATNAVNFEQGNTYRCLQSRAWVAPVVEQNDYITNGVGTGQLDIHGCSELVKVWFGFDFGIVPIGDYTMPNFIDKAGWDGFDFYITNNETGLRVKMKKERYSSNVVRFTGMTLVMRDSEVGSSQQQGDGTYVIGNASLELGIDGFGSHEEFLRYLEHASFSGRADYYYYDSYYDYPNPYENGGFRIAANLPDIKQVDFLKTICGMYGLVSVLTDDGTGAKTLELKAFGDITDHSVGSSDWSQYLLSEDRDAAMKTEYRIDGYARRNRISWKLDKNDPVVSEAFVEVDDDTIDPEKDIITLPFAATDGDMIPQYSLADTGGNPQVMKETEVEPRLMRVVRWLSNGSVDIKLSFQNLSASWILSHYAGLQAALRHPVVVTERLRLPLPLLRTLDIGKPVYLAKYGRYFAVLNIRWRSEDDISEVKLLKLD